MSEVIPFPELLKRFRADPRSLLGQVPGIHLIDKPEGLTSHDVVDRMRRALGLRRVGHGGTLDPMATGLLLILAGPATRLFDELQSFAKEYVAKLELGRRTDTHDRTGQIVEERPVPELDAGMLERALAPFRGEILQVPPMHSAIKRGGRPLYELAREGKTVERAARPVTVYELSGAILGEQEIELRMRVSKGFYVRTLVDDLGQALGCGAVMTELRRTAIGPFRVEEAGTTTPE